MRRDAPDRGANHADPAQHARPRTQYSRSTPLRHLHLIRALFPRLSTGTIMLDNAGGSQLPRCVIDAMWECMERSFVQLGGDCAMSVRASTVIPRAREVVKVLLGGHEAAAGTREGSAIGAGMGEVFFGSSSATRNPVTRRSLPKFPSPIARRGTPIGMPQVPKNAGITRDVGANAANSCIHQQRVTDAWSASND